MSKILNIAQARAVQAFIDGGAVEFVLEWEPRVLAQGWDDGVVYVLRGHDGAQETYRSHAGFTEAYKELLT